MKAKTSRTILVVVVSLLLPAMSASFQSASPSLARYRDNIRLFDTDTNFEIELSMPPSNSGNRARLKFGSVLSVPSEVVEVRYKLPFGLDVAPLKNLAVCTKDGAGGGTFR